MNRLPLAIVLLLVSSIALSIGFKIDYTWAPALPTNQFNAIAAVNSNSAARAHVALPTTRVGETGMMQYLNAWTQPYTIHSKVSSVPWQPSGPAMDLSCVFPGCSPILIDLEGNGIRLGEAGVVVLFDIDADGSPEQLQWVRRGGDEAFLALDVNGNGAIDSGAELFGNFTPLDGQDELPPHGFAALAQYDAPEAGGNADDLISVDDAVWSDLQLWLDRNADGQTQAGELVALDDQNILALGLSPRESKRRDHAGNWLRFWDAATCSGKRKCRLVMVDVFFIR